MNRWFVMGFVAAVAAASVTLADWPGYRGTDNTGVATVKTPPQTLAPDALKQIWRVPLDESFSELAVVGDNAVTFGMRGADEYARCLDAKTGTEKWATKIGTSLKDGNGNGPRTTPLIDGDKVYVYGTKLRLVCLNLADGQPIWSHEIAKEFGKGKAPSESVQTWGNAASPVVVGDVVIVVGGGKGQGILAFNKTTGGKVWAATDAVLTHAAPAVATILGQKQVICFMESGLISVDPSSGKVLWTFAHPYKTSTAASPVVGGKNGDIVYCSAGYDVGAAACRISKTGSTWQAAKLWSTPKENMNHWSTPVYYDGCIFGLFGHNDPHGPLACLDIETGAVKWSQAEFGSQGGIILVGDRLLVQTPKGELVLVAASGTGYQELGRAKDLSGKDWIAPAFIDGTIYARSTTEGVCFKLGE